MEHQHLLQPFGCMEDSSVFVYGVLFPDSTVWEGLYIDDHVIITMIVDALMPLQCYLFHERNPSAWVDQSPPMTMLILPTGVARSWVAPGFPWNPWAHQHHHQYQVNGNISRLKLIFLFPCSSSSYVYMIIELEDARDAKVILGSEVRLVRLVRFL